MKEIFPAAKSIRAVLGVQKRKENTAYRLLTYCLEAPVPEGVLLYNTLTKALLLLEPREAAEMTKIGKLTDDWFLVPVENDDKKLSDQVRAALKLMRFKRKGITGYTILTTTDCNARCFYCYEKGRSRISMGEDTALQTARYIAENCAGEKVALRWFGGEPLYNSRAIDLICTALRERGIDYRSTMTSNGYLFDAPLVARAVELWNLKRVQITLDGTEAVYNRCKAYIYEDGNPFRRVMDNIGLLLDARVSVTVRLNLDLHNADDLFRLVDMIAARFQGKPGLNVYSHVLFETVPSDPRPRSQAHRSAVYQKQSQLQARIIAHGLQQNSRLNRAPRLNQCMADSGNSVLISPEGDLGLCEHFSESEFFGHIGSPQKDEAMLRSWQMPAPETPACSSCVSYPNCVRLNKCHAGHVCHKEARAWAEERTRQAMLFEYTRSLSGQEVAPEQIVAEEQC